MPTAVKNDNFELALAGQPVKNLIANGHEFNYSGKLLVWPKPEQPDQWLHLCSVQEIQDLTK